MNEIGMRRYEKILRRKLADVIAEVQKLDRITVQTTAEDFEAVQLAGEREWAMRNLEREAKLLRELRGALDRIAEGSFGICLQCEEEISPKRLSALPWVRFCIKCQEAAEHHARSHPVAISPTDPAREELFAS